MLVPIFLMPSRGISLMNQVLEILLSQKRGTEASYLLPAGHRETVSSNVRATKVGNADNFSFDAAIHADYGIADANAASNADPSGFSSDLLGFAHLRLDLFQSSNGVRPKTSAPDLGCWDFMQIRLVSGSVKASLGMPSGVARTPGVFNADTAGAITDTAVNAMYGDVVTVTIVCRPAGMPWPRLRLRWAICWVH